VVGAHAMAAHGVPRATGDPGVWVSPDPVNAERVWAALEQFGAPVRSLSISKADLQTPGTVVQIGHPPRRIDLLTELSGLSFEGAWPRRVSVKTGPDTVPFLGREDLVRNKRAAGRRKDLADLEILKGGK